MGKRIYLNLQTDVGLGTAENVSFNIANFVAQLASTQKTYKCRVVFFGFLANPGGTNKSLCIHLPDFTTRSSHFAYGSNPSFDCDAVLTLNRDLNGTYFLYEGSGGEHLWFEGQFQSRGNFRVHLSDGPNPYTPSAGVNYSLKLQFDEVDDD